MELNVGVKGKAEEVVNDANTAKTMGSGTLDVYATPSMIALMEEAAVNALVGLTDDQTSVGTSLNIKHVAATPLKMKVWAEAELIEIDRKRLVFNVTAYDEKETIGSGIHERFIVNTSKFMEKTNSK